MLAHLIQLALTTGTLLSTPEPAEPDQPAYAVEFALRQALRENRFLIAAVKTMPLGLTFSDRDQPDSPIIFANRAFERMTGYLAGEVIGQNLRLLFGPATNAATVAELQTAMAARRPITRILQTYSKDGTSFWNELTISPVFNEERHFIGFVSLHNDVTARMSAEAELTRQAHYQEALLRCAQILLPQPDSAADRIALLQAALEAIQTAVGAAYACLFRRGVTDDGTQYAAAVACTGGGIDGQPLNSQGQQLQNLSPTVVPAAALHILSSGAVWSGPVTDVQHFGAEIGQLLHKLQVQSVRIFPVHIDGNWEGNIVLADMQPGGQCAAHEEVFVRTAVAVLGQAIQRWRAEDDVHSSVHHAHKLADQNARLYEQARHSRERLSVLNRLSHELSMVRRSVPQIYSIAHTAAAALMPVDSIDILTQRDEHSPYHVVYKVNNQGRQREQLATLSSMQVSTLLRNNGCINFDAAAAEYRAISAALDNSNDDPPLQSGLAAPLYGRRQTRGILLVRSRATTAYNDEDQELLELLATYVTTALENTALFNDVEQLAAIDPLTGLLNRRQFFQQSQQILAEAGYIEQPLSLMMIDIDDFKRVNDEFGHRFGDHMLQEVATCCRLVVRDYDIVGRYGGEELIALLPNTAHAGAARVAELVRQAISRLYVDSEHATVSVTASIGITTADAGAVTDLELLLKRADHALYYAKHNGKNQVVAWHSLDDAEPDAQQPDATSRAGFGISL